MTLLLSTFHGGSQAVSFPSWLVLLLVRISFIAVCNFGAIAQSSFGITVISPSNILSNISSALILSSIGTFGFGGVFFFWNYLKYLAGSGSTSTTGF